MQIPGTPGQMVRHPLFDASGVTIASTPVLILPEAKSRSFLTIQNLDQSSEIYIEFGSARATAAITNGVVTSFSITNAGFGFTYPPDIELLGGGNSGNNAYRGVALPEYPSPGDAGYVSGRYFDMSRQRPAIVHAVMTGSAPNLSLASIAIEDGGAGYNVAPLVMIRNSLRDPYGAAIPSATSGIWLQSGGGAYYMNGPMVTTDPVSVFSTGVAAFMCKYST